MAKKPAAPKALKQPKTVTAPVAAPPPPVEPEVIEASITPELVSEPLVATGEPITVESVESATAAIESSEPITERTSRATADRNKYGRAH